MKRNKKIGVLGLSLISINAILGLKNIPFAATIGPSAVSFWILAALLYFIPISLIVAELSTAFPEQGGISAWVERAFGKKAAFLCGWFFWVANFTYYPSLLIGITVNVSYAINAPQIISNTWFTTIVSLVIFWSLTILTLRGTQVSGKMSAIGAPIGVLVPAILIFGFGLASLITGHPSATPFTAETIAPRNLSMDSVMFLSTLMFAFSGIEMIGTIAKDVHNPQRTFPKTILIASIAIGIIYILATAAFQFVIKITPDDTATALYQFADVIGQQFHLPFNLAQILGICFVIAILGSLTFLILNPSIMMAESGKGILPEKLIKANKNDMPANLILWQAAGVSVILISSGFIPSVSQALNMLVLMATLAFFIPYVFLLLAYIKLRKSEKTAIRPFKIKKDFWAYLTAAVGLFSVIGTIVLTLIPASGTTLAEYTPMIIGPAVFALLGLWFYSRGKKKQESSLKKAG
ncbi:amino acid permease [Metabacillus sp. GX 13764]|uniref:APC family permease n=1 Tax=Metabacillus kandeliae TaxID=2900151 RepID=UPI001E33586F|nr:amino acid permease [Metabacillus kandeliae]MCD7033326.1 amino acid permease [Metabacillus kandeliae]